MDPLAQSFIRDYLIAQSAELEEGVPGFRKPTVADPGGDAGTLYPVFIDPRDGAPAPGEKKTPENNNTAVVSLMYSGGIIMPPLEKFHRKMTFDFWVRTTTPQLAGHIESRLYLLLHDKRNWSMAGLQVIESLAWRPMQSVGNNSKNYSYTLSYIFELYAASSE